MTPSIATHGDHRIAIAFTVAALTGVASGVELDDPACVAVSYPTFWADVAAVTRVRRLRLLTAGESHGPGLIGVLEGLPAGMRVSTRRVDLDLQRRQHGYGSGRRMQIERDRVRWTAGIRYGRTLGSPVGFAIDNRDWVNWTDRMSVEPIPCRSAPEADHPRATRAHRPRRGAEVRHR